MGPTTRCKSRYNMVFTLLYTVLTCSVHVPPQSHVCNWYVYILSMWICIIYGQRSSTAPHFCTAAIFWNQQVSATPKELYIPSHSLCTLGSPMNPSFCATKISQCQPSASKYQTFAILDPKRFLLLQRTHVCAFFIISATPSSWRQAQKLVFPNFDIQCSLVLQILIACAYNPKAKSRFNR